MSEHLFDWRTFRCQRCGIVSDMPGAQYGCEGRDDTVPALVRPLLGALREIANEDYRGPRPRSAQIAEKALRNYELDSQIGH